jgi:hypothetical protein
MKSAMKEFCRKRFCRQAMREYLDAFESSGVQAQMVAALLARLKTKNGNIAVGVMKKDCRGADVRPDIDNSLWLKVLQGEKGVVIAFENFQQMPLLIPSVVKRERIALSITVDSY